LASVTPLRTAVPDAARGRDWEQLIGRYNHRVVLALVALGLRLDRAKDVAQATWIKLMDAERQGRLGTLELPGLALKQARFLAIDELRKEQADERRGLALATQRPSPPPDPESAAIAKEQLEAALAAVNRAPGSSQRVFRLLYEEPRLPHAEAAERLGLSTQRVRQILCEVRKTVRVALERGET
jgi:RNA polymerase sigma factor (sigma-70 family)